jgi:hypothetical protein
VVAVASFYLVVRRVRGLALSLFSVVELIVPLHVLGEVVVDTEGALHPVVEAVLVVRFDDPALAVQLLPRRRYRLQRLVSDLLLELDYGDLINLP